MKALAANAYLGPNIHTSFPVTRFTLDLGILEEWPTTRLGSPFIDGLLQLLPGLDQHRCCEGTPGGFVRRMRENEGTLAGHVLEHVAIELQRLAGWNVSYGRTSSHRQPGIYEVVYECQDKDVGIEAGYLAIDLILELIPGDLKPTAAGDRGFDVDEELEAFLRFARGRALGPSTAALVSAAEQRGIPWLRLDRHSLVQLGYGRCQQRIAATITSKTSQIAVDLASDKEDAIRLLRSWDLPVPEQRVAHTEAQAVAAATSIGYPVVIKPLNANHGRGVSIHLTTPEEVVEGFERARLHSDDVIIESQIEGGDFRMLVVNGQLVAVSQRVPGHVVGNGVHTVAELVDAVNQDPRRGEGHDKPLTRLELNHEALALLAGKGYDADTVPGPEETVYLRRNANLSTGGTAIDVTDVVHPDNREMAIRAIRCIGLDVGGVDFITKDITASYRDTGGAICEVNAAPGFRMHVSPSLGQPRDVAGPVIDMLFPPNSPKSIPIASITGTNGKTTTARMLAHILKRAGRTVGLTTTDGVYVDDKLVAKGDMTGPTAARMILTDSVVDVAVLETARGGLVRRGLAYSACNVAACLNVAGDHLGLDGVETIEDLARVKRIVIEAATDMSVLNADDARCVHMAAASRADNLCYVTMDAEHQLVSEHIGSGGIAVVLEEEVITLYDRGQRIVLLHAAEIPATLQGKAVHNVQNAMFAIALAKGLNIDLDTICSALSTFAPSFASNPGRMNVYEGHPFQVMLDYAHNLHAVATICELVDRLEVNGRRIAVLTAPGDRRDEDILNIGKAAAGRFDLYFCHQDADPRGRADLEVPRMLSAALQEGGVRAEQIQIIRSEEAAIDAALGRAVPGDLLLLLADNVSLAWQQVVNYRPQLPADSVRGLTPHAQMTRPAAHGAAAIAARPLT